MVLYTLYICYIYILLTFNLMNSLRKFRSEVKIAQEKLAKLLDVAQPTITKVEKGQMKLPSAWILPGRACTTGSTSAIRHCLI